MAKKKEITLHKDGYRFVFSLSSDRQDIICKGYWWKGGKEPILDWAFPKIPANNLSGNSAIFLDQAVMYAKDERQKTLTKDSEPEVGMSMFVVFTNKTEPSRLKTIWLSDESVYYQQDEEKELRHVPVVTWKNWMKQAEAFELH